MKRGIKLMLIIFGAVSLTALGIDAADTISGSRSTLLGQLLPGSEGVCPTGMIELPATTSFTCVDQYEVSASEKCQYTVPRSVLQTGENMSDPSCEVVSEKAREPWRFVSRDEAQTLCLRSGKRLPTNAEWQQFTLGTPAESCNTSSGEIAKTGSLATCVSAVGVSDAVGNVWEWTSEEVTAGVYNGRPVPATGYVGLADASGIAIETDGTPADTYGADYFWSGSAAVSAIMRGGFYGSEEDAGVYAAHADVAPNFTGEAIGFRCVQ